MGIFTTDDPTKAERIRLLKNKIANNNANGLAQFKSSFRQSFCDVWRIDTGFDGISMNSDITTQDVLDSFGVEAYKLFVIAAKIQKLFVEIDPNYEPLKAPNTFVINQNGTVDIIPNPEVVETPESENENG